MRKEYELKHGRLNPYAARIGVRGRAEPRRWWASATANVRVLPDDLAPEFPDTESAVEALRLMVKLRAVRPKGPSVRKLATGCHPLAGGEGKQRCMGRRRRALLEIR